MKLVGTEKKEKNQVELSIVVEKDEFEAACEKAYRRNVGKINIQGFRKGKAPRKMIEKMYGPEIFYEDAMNLCYADAYEAAVDEAGIEPVDRPNLTDFDIKDGEFSFKAIVTVKPLMTVKNYTGLEAEKEEASVSDSEIDAELERLRERNARLVPVDRPAAEGDTVLIDYKGMLGDKAFDGGTAEGYNLKLGSGTFIPGFEDQLIGKKAGEDCDVNVTFPEDYGAAELAGKAVVFHCKVHEVKESQKPELDDEFAKDVSEFDTLDEYKASLKEKMLESRQKSADSSFEDKLLDQLVDSMDGEIPEVMFENQIDRIVDDFGYRLAMQGMDMNTYLQMNGMEMNSFREIFKGQAERHVKTRLALEAVAAQEKLAVAANELEEEYKKLAEQNKLEIERVKEFLPEAALKADLAVQKAMELVKSSAKALKPKPAKKAAVKKPAAKTEKTEKTEKKTKSEGETKKPAAKKPAAKKPAEKKTTKKDAAKE